LKDTRNTCFWGTKLRTRTYCIKKITGAWGMPKNAGKRLSILSTSEINKLYSLPQFNDEQRSYYFFLDDLEKKEIESLKTLHSKLNFVLQLGYFKYNSMFFKVELKKVPKDINYILIEYFNSAKIPKNKISQKIQSANQSRILKVLGFKLFDQKAKKMLEEYTLRSIKIYSNPRYVFDRLIVFLQSNRIAIPGYSTLQKNIGISFKKENQRLNAVISENISKDVDNELKNLLEIGGKICDITALKKDAKGFNYTEIVREIEKKTTCNKLFEFSHQIIKHLDISEQNIRYYASLVDYYTIDRLTELSYEGVQ
jgi:hypothetical protein